MKRLKYILLASILLPLMGAVSSCSTESEEENDFDNWEQKNKTELERWANAGYQKIKVFSKDASTQGQSSDYIYVEVLESGSGTESPLYTDTVQVAYRGRYIPTKTYADGYVFDQSYVGDFSWRTISVIKGTAGSFVQGFTTALMNMHPGDRWRVRIPYTLGYGESTSSTSGVLGYSDLVFDMALVDFWHPGETHPSFKSRLR